MLLRYTVFDVRFSVPARFLMKGFRGNILFNDSLHVNVWYISQKFILQQVLDIYPRIIFMKKVLAIVQKLHL